MTAAQIIHLAPVSGTWLGAVATAALLLVAAGMHIARHHPVTALWVAVLWHSRRVAANRYHRHGHRHAKPTTVARCRHACRRLASVRLRMQGDPDATVPMPALTAGRTP
jgi:hypothetical protein